MKPIEKAALFGLTVVVHFVVVPVVMGYFAIKGALSKVQE